MTDFSLLFGVALLICGVATFRSSDKYKTIFETTTENTNVAISNQTSSSPSLEEDTTHRNLLWRYLVVYLLATFSDWLQGPYVYALYATYGYSQLAIAQLFVAGFGSSMIFGTFIGGFADRCGRRNFVVLFALIYASSCVTKHFNEYWILMLGRILGGIATSLLFSVFEAWLIRAHADENLSSAYVAKSFSSAAFGNSVVAIIAGLAANYIAEAIPMTQPTTSVVHFGGYINPFDLSIVALIACGICAMLLWEENYGGEATAATGTAVEPSTSGGAAGDVNEHQRDSSSSLGDIVLCGVISSLFEGSMYVFVFMWTPVLMEHADETTPQLPFGIIFATFMVCVMTGSSIFSILVEKGFAVEKLAIFVFGMAAAANAVVANNKSDDRTAIFLAMNVFEIAVGLYFPSMGTMKGVIVPEAKRATIYNLYRVPLNLIVLVILLTDFTPRFAFQLNAIMLGIAMGLQILLSRRRSDLEIIQVTHDGYVEISPLGDDEDEPVEGTVAEEVDQRDDTV